MFSFEELVQVNISLRARTLALDTEIRSMVHDPTLRSHCADLSKVALDCRSALAKVDMQISACSGDTNENL